LEQLQPLVEVPGGQEPPELMAHAVVVVPDLMRQLVPVVPEQCISMVVLTLLMPIVLPVVVVELEQWVQLPRVRLLVMAVQGLPLLQSTLLDMLVVAVEEEQEREQLMVQELMVEVMEF
jgi:hypothetical protein